MSAKTDAVIRQYIEEASSGNIPGIVELTHPDCVISEPASLPYGGEYTGKEAFQELFQDVLATWEVFDFEAKTVVTEGNTSLIIFDVHVENASGESMETQVAEVYQIEDGLISNLNVFYTDTAQVVELLE